MSNRGRVKSCTYLKQEALT